MNKACVLFKISDITMHFPRNYKRYKDVVRINNFSYGNHGAYTNADVYFVKGKDKYPVIVNVHGGGFVKGDKRHRKSICCEFARQGYFVYNVNYRLAPQYQMPAGCIDVANALNSLLLIKDTCKLDLSTVILTGDSAGAFYAASSVVASTNEEYRLGVGIPEIKVKPTAFMGFFGAYRLGDMLLKKTPFNLAYSIASALFGSKVKDAETVTSQPIFPYTDLISYVNADFPKTLLIYSKADNLCGGQGEVLTDKLFSLGVDIKTHIATGEKDTHCFHLLPRHRSTPAVMKTVFEFLKI